MAVTLAFDQIRCRCGVLRVKGQDCGDCGARPDRSEVDFATVERRRQLADVYEVHRSPRVPPRSISLGDEVAPLFAELAVRIPTAFAAIMQDGELGPLCSLAADLAATRQAITGWPLLRPYTQKKRLATECIDALHTAVTEYFEACTSSSIAAAQGHAELMQAALDRAAVANSALVAEEDPPPDPGGSSMESFFADCLAMSSRSSELSVREAIMGDGKLEGLLGLRPASDLGVAFLLAAAGSQTGVDSIAFRATFHAAHVYFDERGAQLEALAEDPDFQRALVESDVVSANCTWQARASMERSQSEQQFVNLMTGLIADMVEGPNAGLG